MDEAFLRKWHRTMGGILALFIFVQALSGAMMAFEFLFGVTGFFGVLTKAHFGGGGVGHLYRLILGLGLAGMAASGGMIYLKIRTRTRKP
jgi:hypothetical protein